ncbi:CpaF family protein [Bifidobacterium samirii]|uniref:Type IV secretion system protein n=1 Tax=Bifidobacterium samirii TaxID=2306974 RepID=A0A430FP49_9BIFI|nr:ATPase, T2SS/T4P/T4SS family [Bifidobacterium samirii]RSX54601.1 type IV secretion system protein [Bifidobacterium samirii]
MNAYGNGIPFGPLEALAQDPRVTDVAVTGDGRVWADAGEGMREYRPTIPFTSPQIVRDYAVRLCAALGRRLDDACPIADASSSDGIRVHAVIAPLVPEGAAISIRFPARSPPRLETLCATGMLPAVWLPLLCALVARRATILITGGTGTGKTTLLKALLGRCPREERIVAVEEVRELGFGGGTVGANRVSLVTREANVEGAGAIGLADLVKATLRMRPDRIILGECRGEEIADLLRAYNSGHTGGMTTLHADGVTRVPSRLAALGLLAGMPVDATAMLAANAFDAVLHLERDGSGRRRIAQIGRLDVNGGYGDGGGDGSDGGFVGNDVATGDGIRNRGAGGGSGLTGLVLSRWDGTGPPVNGPHWNPFVARWVAG